MAFVNITLTRKRPSPIVIILDQLMIVSCDTVITLTALVPNAIKARTFLWEQLSGTVVTWLTPQDEESATFQQSLIKDDKVFRFWVNKGASDEVYAEILVTAIPRDDMPALSTTARNFVQTYGDESVAVAVVIPGVSPESTVSVDNAARGIMYTTPIVTDNASPPLDKYVSRLRVYNVTDGINEYLIADYPPPPYYTLVNGFFDGLIANRNYRVDTVFDINGSISIARGKSAGHYTPTPWGYRDMDTWDRGRVHLTNGTASATIERTVFSVVTQVFSTEFPQSLLNTSQDTLVLSRDVALQPQDVPSVLTYNKFSFTLESAPTESSDIYMSLFDGPSSATVIRLDLGIGGLG